MSDSLDRVGDGAVLAQRPMTPWTEAPEAAVLLASCAADPPRRRLVVYRFQETGPRFVGGRVQALRRLYRLAEPPLDSPAWRAWLALDPQWAIEQAIRSHRLATHIEPICLRMENRTCMNDPTTRSHSTAA